jgi:hypothetical protein
MLRTNAAVTFVVGLTIIGDAVSAAEPIVQCDDIRNGKLQIERNTSRGKFHIPAGTHRFIEDVFGVDRASVLSNMSLLSEYLNAQPETFSRYDKFFVLGDVVGGSGPIFLVSSVCTVMCKSFELYRSSDAYSIQQIEIGLNFLSIGNIAEDVREFKIILGNDQGPASLHFSQRKDVPGEALRLHEYRKFGTASGIPGVRCLQRQ